MKHDLIYLCSILLFFCSQLSLAQDHVVVHTVESGQTLYAISQMYGVTPDEIKETNPLVDEDFMIKEGQILRIILQNEKQIEPFLSKLSKNPMVHTVQAKETLFGISKDYHVDMQKVKEWNNLGDSRLAVGQELIVGWRYRNELKPEPEINAKTTIKREGSDSTKLENQDSKPELNETKTTPVLSSNKPQGRITDKQQLLQQRYDVETTGEKLITKAGPAIWFNTNNRMMSARYYGLFSEAPIGSVIKVKNLINQKVVYVKVIGSLPNTAENHGAMIKMTPAAKHTLGIKDAKIRVEVTYAP